VESPGLESAVVAMKVSAATPRPFVE
jgi:hypothetical protein